MFEIVRSFWNKTPGISVSTYSNDYVDQSCRHGLCDVLLGLIKVSNRPLRMPHLCVSYLTREWVLRFIHKGTSMWKKSKWQNTEDAKRVYHGLS